jgi:Phage tail tube protein FII
MTIEEEIEFCKHGCVSRCLIKLAELAQKPITKDAFCKRFSHLFPNPTTQYGLLDESTFTRIVQDLTLPPIALQSDDYDTVYEEHNQHHRMILVFSKVNLDAGASDLKGHCSVLNGISRSAFVLWTPKQDGTEGLSPALARADWAMRECSARVLS